MAVEKDIKQYKQEREQQKKALKEELKAKKKEQRAQLREMYHFKTQLKYLIAIVAVCLAVLAAFSYISGYWNKTPQQSGLKVGFVYSEDESTPYTFNFVQGQYALTEKYGDKVEILARSNVPAKEAEEAMRELVRKGCRVIFVNEDTEAAVNLAPEYPDVQFCQISMPTISMEGQPKNYHTFNGEIFQARYVSGVVAGLKLKQMIDNNVILSDAATVGYVAANNSAEVVSGYTAFILGVRSVVPNAVMRVRYTGSWSNYSMEKQRAQELINEGCVVIAQHTNTMAPANACEEAYQSGRRIYYVGYHQSMVDVAPATTLVSIRTNWVPYILSATEAVMNNEVIEEVVPGHIHGNDISAGFEQDWVELLELNEYLAAEGTQKEVKRLIDAFKKGKIDVFKGRYTGVNPVDPIDTIDLTLGYTEMKDSSSPSFRYILRECVIEEN